MQRGVDRQSVFFSDSDCARYLNTFGEYAERRNVSLHARVESKFVANTKRLHNRIGGLLEGRFYAGYLEPEGYLLNCIRHRVLNPVREKMVANADVY